MDNRPLSGTPSSEPLLLGAYELSKQYSADVTALQGIDFDLFAGERVALIGSNGSGKSTLLKCLTGLLSATTGTITAFGVTVSPGRSNTRIVRRDIHRHIGWVFQHHGLVRRGSVLSNVVHGMLGEPGSWRATTHHLAPATWRAEAMRSLVEVKLDHLALRRADTLSGGQQQRVAIARALVRKPRVIVADEPAASLDPVSGHDMMQTLVKCQQNHRCALLFTCHDIEHAREYATRIVGLSHGNLVLNCSPGELEETKLEALYRPVSNALAETALYDG